SLRNDGTYFTDKAVHRKLEEMGFEHKAGEWFVCDENDVKAAIIAIRDGIDNFENRSADFEMRPEQKEAVEKTKNYFIDNEKSNQKKPPHFLWNAKMRFGKTFAAYKLAQEMKYKKILVLTFKPAVQNAWEEDLNVHIDFEGWQFIKRGGLSYEEADKTKPFVCFGSFQDYLGKNTSTGGIKAKNKWVHEINWDLVIFDEYHYGAWRETAKDLFESEDKDEQKAAVGEGMEYFKDGFEEDILPITTSAYLYLSGTPFRAIESGEFIEEQIYNWTYSDEQRAKANWVGSDNPYKALARMVLMTYQLPQSITNIAEEGEFNTFDLNTFFSAEGEGKSAKFKFEEDVQKWLGFIRGSYLGTSVDDLKLGAKKSPKPFSDARLIQILNHTFWFLPSVASCYAMRNLMMKKQNIFYHDYEIIVAAGLAAGIGVEALKPVNEAMRKPLESKTITLSCGKLTTGVTVRPWTGIFMLRDTKSPETYFQAAFRVQSPWEIEGEVIKEECYVFDFAPNRALSQIADYSCRLNVNEPNPEKKVADFIGFLPVLASDGGSMKQLDAAAILDMAMSGTSATLLAKRWESALLVNVDDNTLAKLLANEKAMKALENIEGFRNLNQDIETIINKSEAVKKAKKEANDETMTPKEKKELTDAEKEYKTKRKQIQDKLMKFATRIPVFMYLTDFREHSLVDVITKLETGLFKKVTGLNLDDFELLVSLNVFNKTQMNDAVWKFKRYEDASLSYTGIYTHKPEEIGLYDSTLRRVDFEEI
ncbi:MAG: DEAD/DEAH box helicase family protein, partial [Anaerovoracaceae bacterium]